jgi:hypothetical protein
MLLGGNRTKAASKHEKAHHLHMFPKLLLVNLQGSEAVVSEGGKGSSPV